MSILRELCPFIYTAGAPRRRGSVVQKLALLNKLIDCNIMSLVAMGQVFSKATPSRFNKVLQEAQAAGKE